MLLGNTSLEKFSAVSLRYSKEHFSFETASQIIKDILQK